jgi:hypothetical protein
LTATRPEDASDVAEAHRAGGVADIGTSKIACMIARLKPCPPNDALRGRSHAVELIGYSQIRVAWHVKAARWSISPNANRRCARRWLWPSAWPRFRLNRCCCRCREGGCKDN